MARSGKEIRVVPSVLDRLMDDEPAAESEPAAARSQSLREMKQSVREDLQLLFNTRQTPREDDDIAPGPGGGEQPGSLIRYGLPDFSSASVLSTLDRNRIGRALKAAVSTFEPRLCNVDVQVLPTPPTERALHFLIVAKLRVEPAPERVVFDTVFHIPSGRYELRAD